MANNCASVAAPKKRRCRSRRRWRLLELHGTSIPGNGVIARRPTPTPLPVFRLNIMRQALLEYCSPLQCFALAMVFSGFALAVILMAMFYLCAPRAKWCATCTFSTAGTPASESIVANADAATSAAAAASEAV